MDWSLLHNDPARSEELAHEIAMQYWQQRFELEPPVISPAAAIQDGLKIDGGPVLLVETADCCGGGAAGDSVCTPKALLELAAEETALVPVVDPLAAAACGQAGKGGQVTVELGHQLDPTWGEPVTVTGLVQSLSAGQFQYRGGIWDGTVGQMGPTAVLQVGGIKILITSFATYEWCGEQFEALELNARDSKFVVAKNPMNFGMAYGEFAQGTFILDTPGPTPATLKHVAYKHLPTPLFPGGRRDYRLAANYLAIGTTTTVYPH